MPLEGSLCSWKPRHHAWNMLPGCILQSMLWPPCMTRTTLQHGRILRVKTPHDRGWLEHEIATRLRCSHETDGASAISPKRHWHFLPRRKRRSIVHLWGFDVPGGECRRGLMLVPVHHRASRPGPRKELPRSHFRSNERKSGRPLQSVGWRPSILGWRPSLVGWRPSLVGWRL